MPDEPNERKAWTDSDRALAYILFQASSTTGKKIGDKQCKLVARSRKVTRTEGSWSRKLTNYIQADKFIRGLTPTPVYTGNSEKEEFPKLEQLWKQERQTVLNTASEEIVIRDEEAMAFFSSIGFSADRLKRSEEINFSLVSHVDVIAAIHSYNGGERPEGFKESIEYDLIHNDSPYPPKAIMGIAYKLRTAAIITGNMFEGGKNTPCFKRLEELGFKIVPKIKANPNFMQINHRLTSACSAKPFTILAGGTGTGKTNSARMTAASIAGMDNVETVAVGADWTDNRALLGFRNLLAEGGKTYVAPPALRIILKALANPGKPYFLILDEMNLSHVERYFSDFLSSMESKERLKLHDSAQALFTEDGILVSGKVDWPKNFFIIGTVNIDETTYMFSPKVLDRAHVIEFKVSWDEIAGGLAGAAPTDIPALSAEQIDAFMGVALIKDKSLPPEDQKKLLKVLEDLHNALAGSRFVFAHRTARECLNFIASTKALAKEGIVTPPDTKGLIDLAILQKALPKLNGAAGTLSKVLDELIKVCETHGLTLCKEKLESMSRQLKADQFVSFIQ
jgi:hypothetical protein